MLFWDLEDLSSLMEVNELCDMFVRKMMLNMLNEFILII